MANVWRTRLKETRGNPVRAAARAGRETRATVVPSAIRGRTVFAEAVSVIVWSRSAGSVVEAELPHLEEVLGRSGGDCVLGVPLDLALDHVEHVFGDVGGVIG
jgi:hypothetical protein